ncbi:LysR family transcriptional regulator [Saccharopolyspora sp. NFXS83]|uniref:LysR family transcriptional regulator n=1 Tax=Saccharopolyspora sp. NFXS83 TaxID=2993560 RepID=UPI00224A964A|nr:LysR family transcriptional regulator [Saccharopolyspora sp. NFXS83]MCX2729920.1 LysR family transcriptional regulator [Saccharopolyspora sp. NFXS83]
METRELRCFVTVAEELHFGRAAERLDIAQPALSRTVQKIERRLGTPLFVRSSRVVSLTGAGAVLLEEGRNALDAVDAAERRTRRAGRSESGRPGLVLVTMAGVFGELVAKLLDAYSAEADAVPVEVALVHCGVGEPERMLRDGRADVALLHVPFNSFTGLDHEELAAEGQVVVLPAGHPLAAREALRMADVADIPGLPMPRWPHPDGTYPDGPGPAFRDGTQLLQLIGLGKACAVLPESTRTQLTGNVVAVPLADAPAATAHLAWPSHSRSLAVAALVRVACGL